ncbi:RNA pseudouridine synthase [Fructilactobacillus sanfranciscensis]|nr:RNA pseudouridine synthase [Fructilactobacillus sanfranciscensis]POH11388.1 RNA pseudouridine synthase [Fructilactobacillus sanfranciscensis]POH12704.1 RNA pseudouridine synthase [Fructilactobacillus sanfranciscensis]POH13875.1 RNA pseudouridine synthase [Fructilactobacillus sanfranciscensis]POH15271.1 RNA pseudouridine synthase [Fructilactobacillus sanfranciscensis]
MMSVYHYQLKVPNSFDNQSVRAYLSDYLLLPKHLIFSLRTHFRVKVNQKYLPMNFKIHAGDQIDLTFTAEDFTAPHQPLIIDQSKPLKVLWENEDFMIVNKDRGDKTHANQPDESHATLNYAAGYLDSQQPYIVHRLDQQTSGALIIAKNLVVVPILTRLIREKAVKRTYLTWVRGHFKQLSGTINLPIGRDLTDQRKRKINGEDAKRAITHYQVVKEVAGNSLLKVQLETGRTHQIRVHLASLNHPIINDPLYDVKANLQKPMLLHSWKVEMKTPFYHNSLDVTAPLPPEMKI